MSRAMILLLFLSACGWIRPDPVILPFVPGCAEYVALAQAVVEGRRRGQSRDEQRLLVDEGAVSGAIHRAMVESVYDWPRPTTDRDWTVLSNTSAFAAEARCVNRPAATLRGPP